MQNNVILLLFVLILLPATQAYACKCPARDENENFFSSVAERIKTLEAAEKDPENELTVIVGKVKNHDDFIEEDFPHSMILDVKEVLYGNEESKTVKIYGDDGIQCRPYATEFSIGKTYLLALNKTPENEYYISSCGTYTKELY